VSEILYVGQAFRRGGFEGEGRSEAIDTFLSAVPREIDVACGERNISA
jgi:hypothetical protein